MDKNQPDGHLKKSLSSTKCELHPLQRPKYYCSDSKCRTLLCIICMKQHPKEHIQTLTTIEDVKSQAFEILKNETLSRFDRYVEDILKSSRMNDLFKEALETLMQQNTTVDLDDEDVADIIADTLQRKYFEMKFSMNEKIKENLFIASSSANLVAFDFKMDAGDSDSEEDHEETAQRLCKDPPGYYCKEDLETFYAESKGQAISWSTKEQTLACQDIDNPERKWKKFKIPLAFNSLTVINSERLFAVVASENTLLIYSIEEEEENGMNSRIENEAAKDWNEEEEKLKNYASLKICKEFLQEEEILFVSSDHINRLFVVTEGERGLTATVYELKSQNDELELLRLISFEPFDLPKKVVFDRVNGLLFILGDDFLETYKYPTVLIAPLQAIFKIKAGAFHWHQATKRLLLVGSRKLYQFSKGKFRLIRVIRGPAKPIGLTNQGVLCMTKKTLDLVSYTNPNHKKEFVFPSMDYEMSRMQEASFGRFFCEGYDGEVDPRFGNLKISCKAVKIALETPDYLLIYAKVIYSQDVSQKLFDEWQQYGGTIYSQRLLKYNLRQKK